MMKFLKKKPDELTTGETISYTVVLMGAATACYAACVGAALLVPAVVQEVKDRLTKKKGEDGKDEDDDEYSDLE